MSICKKCILPLTPEIISQNEKDHCNLCSNMNKSAKNNVQKENINNLIDLVKKKSKRSKYDCVVAVSGGRDSTYMLYELVTRYNLRCIAAYHRTPFTPDIIDENVKMITKKLNVPLIQMNISNTKHILFTREILKIWLRKPNRTLANLTCVPCKKHNIEVFRIAKEHNSKFVIFGGNNYETFQLGAAQLPSDNAVDSMKIKMNKIIRQLLIVMKRGIKALMQYPVLFRFFPELFLSSVIYLNNRTIFLRLLFPRVKTIDYFYLAGYNENEINRCLNSIGYKIPSNCNSAWRSDCAFSEIKNLLFKYSTGVSYFDAYFSNFVRAGVITRDEALKRSSEEGKMNYNRLQEVCNLLEMEEKVFDCYIKN